MNRKTHNSHFSPLIHLFPLFCAESKRSRYTQFEKLVEDSFQDILTDFKSEKIANYYTEDFILIENGEIWNNDSVRNYLEKARLRTPKPTRENKFDFFNIEIKDDIAWVSYYNTASFTTENSPPRIVNWMETIIAVRTEEGWRIKLLHNSSGIKQYGNKQLGQLWINRG